MHTEFNQNIQQQERSIYYGSLTKQVILQPVKESQVMDYRSNSQIISFQDTSDQIQNALKFRFPQQQLGIQFKNLLIPCTAAYELYEHVPFIQQKQEKEEQQNIEYQGILNQPLIKVNEKNEETTQGFQSGRRSAIIQSKEGKYYRLKGCGNQNKEKREEGFSQQPCNSLQSGTVEIRGAHFYHTVKRELHMTETLNTIFKQYGIAGANSSLGYWKYNQNFTKFNPELKNEFSLIDKYCGVFETLGEKRVITHLIQGLNIIILSLCDQFIDKIGQNDIKALFKKERFEDNQHFPSKTPVDLMSKSKEEISQLGGILQMLEQNLFYQDGNSDLQYVNFLNYFSNSNSNINNIVSNYKQIMVNKEVWENAFKLAGLNSDYINLLNHIQQQMSNISLFQIFQLISFIFARVGFEIGKIMRIMLQNEINWGYYRDHDPYIHHCNAHPNNFVVLDPYFDSQNLIAPLDYDLAFSKSEFININYEDESYGTQDCNLFDSFQDQSRVNLELALSGLEIYENFEFLAFDYSNLNQNVKDLFETFNVGLRDTMMIYYQNGIKNQQFSSDISVRQNPQLHNLIKMALIFTAEQVC